MRQPCIRTAVCCFATLSGVVQPMLFAESTKTDISSTIAPMTLSSINKPKVPAAEATAAPSKNMNVGALYQYKHKNGSLTLTNRPQKYQHRPEYTQVHIEYQRVTVPKKYTQYTDPAQYTNDDILGLVKRYSSMYGLDPNLVLAVIRCESNFNPRAVSRAGASGLMQLMPATAAEMGVTKIFDPAQNIAGGTQYLYKMLELFDGDTKLALAGYNAGPENVKKYKGIPPFKETQNYVKLVLKRYSEFGGGAAPESIVAQNWSYNKALETVKIAKDTIAPPAKAESKYILHFSTGLSQPADAVEDKDPYYYIMVGARTYPVRKQLVSSIEEVN